MTLKETLEQLKSLGDEKTKARNIKQGIDENHFGVKRGDVRKIAKKIKINHELAWQLWETKNYDAMSLATLIVKPNELTTEEIEKFVSTTPHAYLADWVNSYIVKEHPQKEELRQQWVNAKDPMLARTFWSLTTERVTKNPEGLDISALLDRIEKEMSKAPEDTKWTMNFCLAEIGINFPEHRERAIQLGEKIGAYKDYPVSKGCVSPYAPIWINEMVSRQK